MNLPRWLILALVIWAIVAPPAAFLVGGAIRHRDRLELPARGGTVSALPGTTRRSRPVVTLTSSTRSQVPNPRRWTR